MILRNTLDISGYFGKFLELNHFKNIENYFGKSLKASRNISISFKKYYHILRIILKNFKKVSENFDNKLLRRIFRIISLHFEIFRQILRIIARNFENHFTIFEKNFGDFEKYLGTLSKSISDNFRE